MGFDEWLQFSKGQLGGQWSERRTRWKIDRLRPKCPRRKINCLPCEESRNLRLSAVFRLTESVTPVSVQAIAVVTLFAGIEDAVSTARVGAIGTAGGICGSGVPLAIVAFFTRVDFSIAAHRGDVATVHTLVRERRIMQRLLALFPEQPLHDTVPANSLLQKTRSRASVTVTRVAVVTFLGGVEHTVAADRRSTDERRPWFFFLASGRTPIARQGVSVIAFFGPLHQTITAE